MGNQREPSKTKLKLEAFVSKQEKNLIQSVQHTHTHTQTWVESCRQFANFDREREREKAENSKVLL